MSVRKTTVIPAKAGIQRGDGWWDTNRILLVQVLPTQLFMRKRGAQLPYYCVRR